MIRITMLTIALALALSACFNFENPFPDNTVRLSASSSVASVGEEITFTAEHDRGEAHIRILETELSIDPPQTVRALPVLTGDASIFIDEKATLSLTLEEGRNDALGRDIYRFDDGSDTVLAWSGERVQVTGSGTIRLTTTSDDMVRDGIQSATFTISMVGSDETTTETIILGEKKTVSLDGQSATLEIIDVTMGDTEIEEIVVRAEYAVPILGTQSIDLDFTMGSGKRIDTGTKRFDVFLTDVTYSLAPSDDAEIYLESGSDQKRFVIGRPVTLDGTVIIPLQLSSGSSLSATVLVDPDVVLIGLEVVRYPDETLSLDHSFERTTGRFSFTEDDSDSLFSTYRLENGRIIDTYSAQRVASQGSSATYRFFVAGDYTARASVTDAGVSIGEAERSVLIN